MADQVALEVNMGGVFLPGSAEVRFVLCGVGFEVRGAVEGAALERVPRVLARVRLPLGRVRVLLPRDRGLLRDDSARLERNRPVSEDEVDGACDVAFAVILAERVRVERVLPAIEGALVECGLVCTHTHCHRLVACRAGCVTGGECLADETRAFNNCAHTKISQQLLSTHFTGIAIPQTFGPAFFHISDLIVP